MKTGRVRSKDEAPAEEPAAVPQPSPAPSPAPLPAIPRPVQSQAGQIPKGGWIVGGLFVVFVCFIIMMTVFGRKAPEEWVEATRVMGEWTTTVAVFGPQVRTEERWQRDCTGADAVVRAGTCTLKETNRYNDTVVDEYEEYAYNLYYEETYAQVYEARGADFAVADLKTDDWWEDNRRYVRQETLDRDSCTLTGYAIWIDDPQNRAQEIEVYLSDCEVWDHVTVYERRYEQENWCQCDVTTLAQMGVQTRSGAGAAILWPQPLVPQGGETRQSFQGKVTFLGADYVYTTTTQDVGQYQDYLTSRYYLGLRDGQAVTISKNPPKK